MFVYGLRLTTFSDDERNIRDSKPDNDPATPNALAPSTIYNPGPNTRDRECNMGGRQFQ
jgi:hypothetical protein